MSENNRSIKIQTEIDVENALRELKDLAKHLSECEKALDGYTKGTEDWNRTTAEIANFHRKISEKRSAVREYYKEFKTGNKSINELASTQRNLNRIVRELDPDTKEWRQYASVLNTVKKRSSSLHKEFQNTNGTLCKLSATAARIKNYVVSGFGVTALLDKLQNLTEAYLTFTDLQADVMKTTGLSSAEVESLSESFKEIDTRSSREELMQLAATAGKLGISAKEDVEGFVRAADQINVALGEDLGEGAIREIGKISDVFGLTDAYGIENAYLKIGSAINSLGQDSTASESYLVEFTQRLSGVAKQAGISVDQILGYGSAMDQNGQNVEMAATAFQGFITKIFSDTATFARIANMDVSAFTQMLQTDANQAIRTVLTALSEKGGFQQLIPVFESMNLDGSRAVSVLASMASNIQAVETAQEEANKAFTEGTSITNEFNVKNNNAAAKVEKMRNRLTEIRVEIGQKLLPILVNVSSGFNALLQVVSVFASFLPKTTGGLIAYTVALGALLAKKISFNGILTKVSLSFQKFTRSIRLATTSVKGFKAVMNTIPFAWIISAIGAIVGGIVELTAAQRESRKAWKEFMSGMKQELSRVDALFNTLKDAEKGTRDYADAKKVIIDQYGQYLDGLINEKGELIDIEAAYKRITAAVKERWAVNAREQAYNDVNERYNKKQMKKLSGVRSQMERIGITNGTNQNLMLNDLLSGSDAFDVAKAYNIDTRPEVHRSALRMINTLMREYNRLETDRKTAITGIEAEYAPFMSNFSQETQLKAYQEELMKLQVQENTESNIGFGNKNKGFSIDPENLTERQKRILELQHLINELKKQLNPKVQKIEPTEIQVDAEPGRESQEAGNIPPDNDANHIDALRKQGERIQKIQDELLQKSREAMMSADELEIEQVKKKYQEELEAAQSYMDNLMAILQDKNANDTDKQYAQANIGKALDTVSGINIARDKEIDETRYRQQQDHWNTWNAVKATSYGEPNQKEKRDQAIQEVDKWEADSIEEARKAFDSLGLTEGSDEYMAEYQALQDAEVAICQAAAEEKEQINREYEETKLKAAASGIQQLQSLLQNSAQMVGDLKQLELDRATAAYDKEKEYLDEQLDRKQISQKTYNKKVEKLEEEKAEKEKEINKKYRLAEFAMQVAQIISTTALAAMQAYQSAAAIPVAGIALGPIAAAAATAFGAVQLGIATAQYNLAKGYSKGGFTPAGDKDEPAGIVHKGEYVVPKWVLNTPMGINYVNLLEAIRTNKTSGYKEGGQVSPTPSQSIGNTAKAVFPANTSSLAEIYQLLTSIDRKLNGVSLVYLDRELKDLNNRYAKAKKDFGVSIS